MKYFEYTVLGSGISSFIFFKSFGKKLNIISTFKKKICKNKNFYEYDGIGGNSNIWGGYINYERHRKYLKHRNYKKIFERNLLKIRRIFKKNSVFSNTYSILDINDKIFRLKKEHFKKNIITEKIDKIIIGKKFIKLRSSKKLFYTKKLILCIGNLNLIKLLFKSNIIGSEDIVSFDDGDCNYILNLFIDKKKNYYIPMPVNKIIEKIFFKKSKTYSLISSSVVLQKFTKRYKKYSFKCKDLLSSEKFKLRYFLTNHVANLRINNVPIRKFIKNKNKNIDIFCSGALKKYLPGPIIQDMIYNITK